MHKGSFTLDTFPMALQDNEAWADLYDPHSSIAYEALREMTTGPYGTGDAMTGGWPRQPRPVRDLPMSVILGALIDTTDVPGILKLDLLATDYYHGAAYPSYLIYNPTKQKKQS